MRTIMLSSAVVVALSGAAGAQGFGLDGFGLDGLPEVSIGAGASLPLGATVEATVIINDLFSVRGVGGVPLGVDLDQLEVSDYEVQPTLEFGGGALFADFHPFGSIVRLSGGVLIGGDEFANSAFNYVGPDLLGSVDPDDLDFDGFFGFDNSPAPVVSIGVRYTFNNGIYLSGDVGAVITTISATAEAGTEIDDDLQAEINDLNDDLSQIPAVPYVALAIGFQF